MQLNITGKNITVTPAIRDHVESKFKKIKRHFDQLIDIKVILDVEKISQHAEATISIRGKSVFAEAESSDLYSAIDSMVDKLDRQVLKYKEKLKHHDHITPRRASSL